MATSPVIGWRILFLLWGTTMTLTFAYRIAIDGFPFHEQFYSRLTVTTVIDIYIGAVALATWISYKEANWIASTIWIVFLVCFTSVITCAYILWQLWQLSSQDSFEDIMYHVLIRNPNKIVMEQQHRKHSNVMIATIVFTVLSCLMAVDLVYFFTDSSPLRKEVFTPWMVAIEMDFYIYATVFSIWMFYKDQESWLTAIVWIVPVMFLGRSKRRL